MGKQEEILGQYSATPRRKRWLSISKVFSLVLLAFLAAWYSTHDIPSVEIFAAKLPDCHTPLPPIQFYGPLDLQHPALIRAGRQLERAVQSRFKKGTLDSINIAIVTAEGSIWELSLGAQRANETDPLKRGEVNRDSIYRVASVSKLFTMVETLILQQKGVLKLDDPITRFFPNFTYIPYGCSAKDNCEPVEPITLRQLATHMSGIARDLPAGEAVNWPQDQSGGGPPPINGLPFPTTKAVLASIANTSLIAAPYTVPIYSNTGWSLLGACNVAANRLFGDDPSPSTHWELLKRDVLDPLGFNGTYFLANDENKARIAIGSAVPEEVDLDFLDWSNPAGGQMTSLHDLINLMQSVLEPNTPGAVLTPYTLREWIRPFHAFGDDYNEIGAAWEILKIPDSYGIKQRIYQKYGNLASFHSAFAINPEAGFGVALLTTAAESQTLAIVQDAFKAFQPAFDRIRAEKAMRMFGGPWELPASRTRKASQAKITFKQGSLLVEKLALNGTDILELLARKRGSRGRLWWTGGDEFRVGVDNPGFEGGCFGQFADLDEVGRKRGTPINTIRFTGPASHRSLVAPAAGITLRRKL
ncbi:beta-lactamase/transpeptidase-like protein [Calocera viscosa TUFC12733]|uniref:Beta-lactamase/transpeptidase-like protein n=1 Tax=Calocera viscosa (strain TUFC12733) TaxID=1330018 RepID=A0A167HGZ6_CALVF|nr:beta-lactamase/transpeptidase-like protein [Calocera viscosa TUFC12733]